MARTPVAPDLNRRILRMEEEIRQLRLRRTGGATDEWHDLAPYLHAGWASLGASTDSPRTHWARYRREGDRVHFGGTAVNVSAGAGATRFIDEMPAGYSPGPYDVTVFGLANELHQNGVVFQSPDGSGDPSVDAWWYTFAEKTQIYVYASHTFYTAAPDIGGVPEGQALNLCTLTPYSTSLTAQSP